MKERWDIFILILAFQNSLIIPIDMSFEPEWTAHFYYQIFDNLVDFLFLVDMILMCFTSFIDPQGKEVFRSVQIIRKYVFSRRFVTDFAAILGTGVVTQFFPSLKIFGFFKMIRIFRLEGMITSMNIPEDAKALFNLLKYTFYICLYNHIFGCAWFSIVKINANWIDEEGFNHTWYPPTDWINYSDAKLFSG